MKSIRIATRNSPLALWQANYVKDQLQKAHSDLLVEIVEVVDHPWFVAVQFHPEFKSKPTASHPLFSGFVQAAVRRSSNGAKKEIEV